MTTCYNRTIPIQGTPCGDLPDITDASNQIVQLFRKAIKEKYDSGEMASWVYGPECSSEVEPIVKQLMYRMSCKIIGLDALLHAKTSDNQNVGSGERSSTS